jgi:hypothetical protein
MAHNLTETDKGIGYYEYDEKGKEKFVKLTNAHAVTSGRTGTAWHQLNDVRDLELPDAVRHINPDNRFDAYMQPLYVIVNGKRVMLPFASVGIDMEDGEFFPYGAPVNAGKEMTDIKAWNRYNKGLNGKFTKAANYEVVTATAGIDLFSKVIQDETGFVPMNESMAFLGKNGRDGIFAAIALPAYDSEVARRIGSEVQEYLHVYLNPSKGFMLVYNSSVVAVCQNTLIFGVQKATSLFKIDNRSGATERLEKGLKGAWGNAISARELAQEAAMILCDKKIDGELAREIVKEVHPDPEQPDPSRITKSDWNTRVELYDQRVKEAEIKRDFIVDIFENDRWHDLAGITQNVKGSGFALWQAQTFASSHSPYRNTEILTRELAAGAERRNIVNMFTSIATHVAPEIELVNDPASKVMERPAWDLASIINS